MNWKYRSIYYEHLPTARETITGVLFLTIGLSILVVAASLFTWHILTRPPVPPQATCGTFSETVIRASVQQKQRIERCFSQAYQRCATSGDVFVGG